MTNALAGFCGGCGKPVESGKEVSATLSESSPYVSPCCLVELIENPNQACRHVFEEAPPGE